MRAIDLLDRPIAFHRVFAQLTGSVTAGLMLSQAWYWSKRCKNSDGWFYKTQQEWYAETYLSRKEQETARSRLRDLGDGTVWREELRGVPATLYFWIDVDKLEALLLALENETFGQSSMPETGKLECPKGANKSARKGQTYITETTTETTTEKSTRSSGSKNPHYDYFADAYRRKMDYPYQNTTGDFRQYATWKKRDAGITDEPSFKKAVDNYLASPQGKYTFADLVTRFAVFRLSALDRFGKPVETKTPTPGSAAPLPRKTCGRCVNGYIMPTNPGDRALRCSCQEVKNAITAS